MDMRVRLANGWCVHVPQDMPPVPAKGEASGAQDQELNMNDSRKEHCFAATAATLGVDAASEGTVEQRTSYGSGGTFGPGDAAYATGGLESVPVLLGLDPALVPVPQLPDGVTEEESLSMSTLSAVLDAYYRTIPPSVRGEYVAQVMRYAGEKAGQLIRICSEH